MNERIYLIELHLLIQSSEADKRVSSPENMALV